MRTIRPVLLLLFAVGVGCAMSVPATTSALTQSTSPETDGPTFVFVQQAAGGSFTPTGDGEWELTLTGVFPQTVYFTERPARGAGAVATAEFLTLADLFDPDNPPNAAVVFAEAASDGEGALVVELLAPAYDPAAATLRYTVIPVERTDQTDALLPGEFDHVTLFIDGTLDDPSDPTDDSDPYCLLSSHPLFCP